MDYFNALMPTDTKITPDEVVVVLTPAYFDRLAEILRKTSKRTIANYFVWRYVQIFITFFGCIGKNKIRFVKILHLLEPLRHQNDI